MSAFKHILVADCRAGKTYVTQQWVKQAEAAGFKVLVASVFPDKAPSAQPPMYDPPNTNRR